MKNSNLLKFATLSLVFMQIGSSPTMANHLGGNASRTSMVWTYHQYNDALNKGRTTSEFQVGIPQTDDIVARGTCAIGSSGAFSKVIFGANFPSYQIGETLTLTLNTSRGRLARQGVAIGADFDEGISGVELTLDNKDKIWQSLSNMNSVTYNINGQTYTLPLRGSGNTIAKFLRDCNGYANQYSGNIIENDQPLNTDKPDQNIEKIDEPVVIKDESSFDPRWASCDNLQNNVSQKSDFPITMTIVNKTNSHRAVMWIDFKGNPKEYASLDAGEKYTINTYVTHPWMFTDGPGNCLEMFMPHQGVDTFNITAPNRDFGPE